MKLEKGKKNLGNKTPAVKKQGNEIDETDFLEYDEPYKDDPFKEHEVIIS